VRAAGDLRLTRRALPSAPTGAGATSPSSLLPTPVVGAPLAGGPSTPALAAAVSDAGGFGFIAAGYKTTADVAKEIVEVRAATRRSFGVNIFFPTQLDVDEEAVDAYARRLASETERYGVACGEPRWSDDEWDAKLELVARERPAVVSFTFGCPDAEVVASLRSCGVSVWCTVTSPAEAQTAAVSGVDALVVQGAEAGGHQSSFHDPDTTPSGLISLLQLVRRETDLPLVAAGGIATGRGVAAVLAAGAAAAQIGSALMLTPEAGTSEPHRAALTGDAPTALTRAFTGRRARGIVNRFMREHEGAAPRAYPQVHYLTAPLRAAARAAGDAEGINLWAGQGYRLVEPASASELVERWTAEARATIAGERAGAHVDRARLVRR
jgi:nitronate monooxygenase